MGEIGGGGPCYVRGKVSELGYEFVKSLHAPALKSAVQKVRNPQTYTQEKPKSLQPQIHGVLDLVYVIPPTACDWKGLFIFQSFEEFLLAGSLGRASRAVVFLCFLDIPVIVSLAGLNLIFNGYYPKSLYNPCRHTAIKLSFFRGPKLSLGLGSSIA